MSFIESSWQQSLHSCYFCIEIDWLGIRGVATYMRTVISLRLFSLLVLCCPGVSSAFSGLIPVQSAPIVRSAFWNAGEKEDEEEPPPSRQNMILRAFFRQQYIGLRTERYDVNETFMEKYVDRQIDAFLEDVESRLEKLNNYLAQAVEAHAMLLDSEDSVVRKEASARYATALKRIDDSAGGLKGKLLHIFPRIDSKERLPIEIDSTGGYQDEMRFLTEQVEEAENRIRDYLFRTTNTVPYQNLRRQNMMIRLYWAEKTADGIKDSLKR